MNLTYWLPVIVVVCGNVFYHICAKSVPGGLNPFFSGTVTYIIAAVTCAMIFLFSGKDTTVAQEAGKLNWAPICMGIAIILMEIGNIYVYRVGWSINVANICVQGIVAVCLIAVGYMLFSEAITATKVAGLAICLVGLFLMNK